MTTTDAPVLAAGPWKNNAELIADCHRLGYLDANWATLDPTYGLGRFWTLWRPTNLTACDLDKTKSPLGRPIDFRYLPFPDNTFQAVVFDPPYKLNGTSGHGGAATSDADYGVDECASVDDRHQLICEGITECINVLERGNNRDRSTGGYLLVKAMDQVNGGKVRWQTRTFADHAETHDGVHLVDMLHLTGYRAQPPGRTQQHARRNYSTLLVFRKT